ncbi:MAG: tail fiber protein [Syntrophomonadaceae bacterium]|nr:tail fiber protein [Syntrophomonadaceae bacterium]
MDQYVGEIRMFGGNYAPEGWAFCNGQLLSISQYNVLYAAIGTTYGGDGQTNFALPDLRGRIALNGGTNPTTGTNYALGLSGGTETVTLIPGENAAHTHSVAAVSTNGAQASPENAIWAKNITQYAAAEPNGTMSPAAVTSVGGNQPHEDMMPYLPVNFIIALEGDFPVSY